MALAGITAAFVVISIVFIGAMLYLNNPLEKVPDVQVPDFKGLKYDAVTKAEEYSSFTFEVEDNQYNDLYERGAIISPEAEGGNEGQAEFGGTRCGFQRHEGGQDAEPHRP